MITAIFAVITFALLLKLGGIIGRHIGSEKEGVREVPKYEKIVWAIMGSGRRFDLEDFVNREKIEKRKEDLNKS